MYDEAAAGRHVLVLRRSQVIARTREEVFGFFADALNLEAITPPWLGFEVLTPGPIRMEPGTLIAYRMRLRGIPVRWLTRIERWHPGSGFLDAQLKGPYRSWRHAHTFEDCEGGTLMRDLVRYELPFGLLGRLGGRALVAGELRGIFDFREDAVRGLLG